MPRCTHVCDAPATRARRDLFDRYGLRVPATWDEFVDLAQRMNGTDTDGDGHGDLWGVCFDNGTPVCKVGASSGRVCVCVKKKARPVMLLAAPVPAPVTSLQARRRHKASSTPIARLQSAAAAAAAAATRRPTSSWWH